MDHVILSSKGEQGAMHNSNLEVGLRIQKTIGWCKIFKINSCFCVPSGRGVKGWCFGVSEPIKLLRVRGSICQHGTGYFF